MKILICRFSSIGDIVLTSPLLRCLSKQLNAEIHYLTKEKYSCILKNNPFVKKTFLFNQTLKEVITPLKQENYDCFIDLQNNIRSLYLKVRLGVKVYSFPKTNIRKWLMVNFKINILSKQHLVDRYFKTTAALGVVNDNQGLDYFIHKKEQIKSVNKFDLTDNLFIVLCLGGQHNTKKLPLKKLISLCQYLSTQTIITLGDKSDYKTGKKLSVLKNVFNACGKFSLNESASIIHQAEKVITHDTGLMHIAAAFNKKIISVWGSTIPDFGMTPYQVNHPASIHEVKKLRCRPCSKIGYKKCPQQHFRCMEKINLEKIAVDVLSK